MSVPGIVQSTLTDEDIAARVSLGGEDELFITPTRTLVYRAEGLLSDESVDEFPHDADRLTLSEGRRKTKFTLEYALDGSREFSVPAGKTDAALHPVLAGVLNGNDITEPGETVVQTYRFSELTLIITSERLVKHIGGAVWDEDYEEYHFGDVTNLAFEDGSVATQIVLTADGRPQRIKAPNEEANDLRERLERALFEYHDVDSLAELNERVGEDEPTDDGPAPSMDFGDGVDPLDTEPAEPDERERAETEASAAAESAIPDSIDAHQRPSADDARDGSERTEPESVPTSSAGETRQRTPVETGDVFEESSAGSIERSSPDPDPAAESAPDADLESELLERVATLEDAVERQNDLLEQQQRTIEQLIAELKQGR
ncbi:DUF7115 domain-containing protein [Natrarchaeobius oligotrophus]|uniref:DUF7115 domain-containing protein n=1 Tax=Natrarchaeobius chitinivorans TaxID=1679083 RepID=A0A3N6NDL8_NATCH|nr:hypothetical protein [Natrarchaeobius chitinivorans]RQG96932.1 hypothetical protein EA472_19695 [Natrarchaeobius chitinivorans]